MSTLDEDDIDAIARRVVELLLPALRPQPTGPTTTDAAGALSASAEKLLTWVRQEHPEQAKLAPEDLHGWAAALADSAGDVDPTDALAWAWSPNCPTTFWRTSHRPIAVPVVRAGGPNPGRSDRGYRYGPWLQLLAEYRLACGPGEALLQEVDRLVAALVNAVNSAGSRLAKATVTSRKNALTIMGSTSDDPETILQVVKWCLASRPHWRSNLKGVPPLDTYRSMRGDWTGAGHGFTLDTVDDPTLRAQVDKLSRGWAWYLGQALDRPVGQTSRSLQRIHDLLTGAGGEPSVELEDAQVLVGWILDPNADRARYYTDGLDFPRPERARKALLDMRSGATVTRGVTGTNSAAADSAGSLADDELKGML